MAVFTPRGLKLRMPINYVFPLLQRLHPKVSAFKVLQTTEAMESLLAAWSFVLGLVAFLNKWEPEGIALAVGSLCLFLHVSRISGFPVSGLLVEPARIYSLVGGYGVLFLLLMGIGWWKTGWRGVAAYLAGRIGAGAVNSALNLWRARRSQDAGGPALTQSELSFFAAFIYHAAKIGASRDLALQDWEEDEESWLPALSRLELEWPQVAARFTPD